MKTGKEILTELTTRTYASVPFALSHQDISDAVANFFDYLTLPQEVKDPMVGKRPTDPVSDMGYIRTKGEKDEEIGKKDHKEYFHYHPEAETTFPSSDPKVRAFFDAAGEVYAAADTTIKEVIRELEGEFPGIYELFFPKEYPSERILRFLKYDSRGMGEFLARGHYDRGGCTLALAESAPGLRIGKDEGSLDLIRHQDRTAIFMPAYHFPQITDNRVPAAWHDVVQASEDVYSGDAARWAVVFFVNAPGLAHPSSKETHILRPQYKP